MAKKRTKCKSMHIRVTDEWYNTIKYAADSCGMTVSDYILSLVRDDVERSMLGADYSLSEEDYWNGH